MVLSTTPPRAARRWATPAAIGLFAAAVALSGVTVVRADDKPKPPPTEATPDREPRRGPPLTDKPPEAAPRRSDAPGGQVLDERNFDVRVRPDVNKLRKQIDEALAAGKTDEAKRLVDGLIAALTPPPAPPPPPTGDRRGTMAIVSADPRIMDAHTAMRKAIDATKDPEARAAMESAFRLLRDMPQERKMTQTFVGPDGRETVVQHGQSFGGMAAGPGMPGGPGGRAPGVPNDVGMRPRNVNTFGVTVAPVPEALAEQLQLPADVGLVVTAVRPESPFAKAGVKKSDVITAVGTVRLTGAEGQLWLELAKTEPGKPARVVVFSKGVEKTLDVAVPQRKEALDRPAARRVRFESMKMEVFNGGVSVEAKQGDRQYKITGARVGELLDNAVITVTDSKTGKATTQSGTVLDQMDERDRAAVQTLLDQIRGQ